MIQVTIVLNKIECLDELMKKLTQSGIPGGTILDSHGMARSLRNLQDEFPFMASLREILDLDQEGSKTIFMIAEESQVRTISQILNEVTGGLENPNTGILFCTPVVYIEGLRKNRPRSPEASRDAEE